MLEWMRRTARRIDEIDRDLVRRSARLVPGALDPAMKILTISANHSVLWFAVAAALATSKGVTRRAAFRGVVAIAGASFTANGVAKPLLPRRRPAAEDVPAARTLSDPPESSSFPSGHAASAAAFATAVALESPLAGAALAPLAATVAYSRVHTGVHWPSDVAVGALLGGGVALASRRWWPVRPDEPARVRPAGSSVPALPAGDGLLVLVNTGAGTDHTDPALALAAALPAARVVHRAAGSDLADALHDAIGPDTRGIGVAGGDGTVATAAGVAADRRLPLAVVPSGTLNHFARDLGVGSVAGTAGAVASGHAAAVDVGSVSVDGGPRRQFVNTASLGGYPDMVRWRERYEGRWGKWPAAAAALVVSLWHSTPLQVQVDGRWRSVWMVFVGSSPYRPRGMAPSWRPRMDTGLLEVRYLRADMPLSRSRFVFAALTGTVGRSRTYHQRECPEITVEIRGTPVAVATDGEVGETGRTFRFRSEPGALLVYRLPDAAQNLGRAGDDRSAAGSWNPKPAPSAWYRLV